MTYVFKFLYFLVMAFFLSSFMGCSKEERFTQRELVAMAKKADPEAKQVPIPNHEPHRRILCRDYGQGCVEGTGRRILIRKVELIAIAFESKAYAKAEAQRINQYYARNWLFDDVYNEPVLIDFIENVYNAKPGREAQEEE